MVLHVGPVDYANTTFPQSGSWDLATLAPGERSLFDVRSIAAAPGKHEVAMCAGYEAEWRRAAPSVISALNDAPRACFVWAEGPMDSNQLPYVFRYMAGINTPRYHVEGVTHVEKGSYVHSWLCFEYARDSFELMMADEETNLEYTRLYMLWFDERWVSQLVPTPFQSIGLPWLLANDAMALSFHRHFEGCYILGTRGRIENAVRRVTDGVAVSMDTDRRGL
jgi:hypothetical protein